MTTTPDSTVPAAPAPPAGSGGRGAVRIVALVIGSLLALVSMGVAGGGGFLLWADRTQRDAEGYLTASGTLRTPSDSYAIVARDISIDMPGGPFGADRLGRARITVTSENAARPIFVGIAARDDADAYLSGVARDELSGGGPDPFGRTLDHHSGAAPASEPLARGFWKASAAGTGTRTVTWQVANGHWSVVVMNADALARVAVDARVGLTVPFLLGLSVGLLAGGVVLALLAALLIVLGARAPRGPAAAPATPRWAAPGGTTAPAYAAPYAPAAPAPQPTSTASPVRVTGRLDEPLSRGLWLVKWLLVIPHAIVLAFLIAAFVLLTFVAWVAILVTGRYPRPIFDFNVGVLRWAWRVSYYGYSALGTDRYPPFSLEPGDYPASFDVEYPPRLSRGLALVKTWLLAIPHYLIVGLLVGGGWWTERWHWWPGGLAGGLIGILVIIAAIVLLVGGRYPRPVFDLVMGFNRWVLRVVVYAALMTDVYPPFRLDVGGEEPQEAGGAPALPASPAAPQPTG